MPTVVTFPYQNKTYTMYFSHIKAALPVKLKNGESVLVPWGRRQYETSEMPMGGWIMNSSILEGRCDYFTPKPVKLLIDKFMQIDYEGRSQWFEVMKDQWIQGILLKDNDEYRVYMVMVVPDRLDVCYHQWPKIVIS